MAKIRINKLIAAMAAPFLFLPLNALASSGSSSEEPYVEETIVQQTTTVTRLLPDGSIETESFDEILPADSIAGVTTSYHNPEEIELSEAAMSRKRAMSRMMFGLELGTGIDLSGTDLSTFNADLIFGYRHKIIQLLGVKVGIHKSLGSRDSFIPICAVLRSSFRTRPSLFFMHMSAGYSFNTISSSPMFGDIVATIGGGVNLVQRPKFQSNITLALGFRHFNQRHQELASIHKPNVGFAQISFGISM